MTTQHPFQMVGPRSARDDFRRWALGEISDEGPPHLGTGWRTTDPPRPAPAEVTMHERFAAASLVGLPPAAPEPREFIADLSPTPGAWAALRLVQQMMIDGEHEHRYDLRHLSSEAYVTKYGRPKPGPASSAWQWELQREMDAAAARAAAEVREAFYAWHR